MADKINGDERAEGVLIVEDPNVVTDEVISGEVDHQLEPGTPVEPVYDYAATANRITAGEYRANGIEIDPKVKDDDVPGFVQVDRHVAPGTPVEPVPNNEVVTAKPQKSSGRSAADRVAALDDGDDSGDGPHNAAVKAGREVAAKGDATKQHPAEGTDAPNSGAVGISGQIAADTHKTKGKHADKKGAK